MAAYFALDSTANESTHLAVWAVNLRYLNKRFSFQNFPRGNKKFESPSRIKTINVSRAANDYLHAQHGFFLLDNEAGRQAPSAFLDEGFIADVGNWLTYGANNWKETFGAVPPLTKFILRRELASEALYMLYKDGITYAHIYPSYDNVAKTLKAYKAFL